MINQGQLDGADCAQLGEPSGGAGAELAAGRILHQTLSQASDEWRTAYGARAYPMSGAEMEVLER